MAPRRNPDIAVAALWENGEWGKNSAKLVAQVITAFVDKQRKREGNLRIIQAAKPADAPAAPDEEKPDAPAVEATPAGTAAVKPVKREDVATGTP